MRYTALKSCRIGGKNYNKGDIIQPDELSAYEGLKLVRYGILCELPINAEEMVGTDTICCIDTDFITRRKKH